MKNRPALRLLFVAFLPVLAIAGCASLTTVFSKGGGALGDARRDLAEGRSLESILKAIDSVKLDPRLVQAQEFLRDNADRVQSEALAGLAASSRATDTHTIAARVRTLSLLVRINTGLGSLKLPFKDRAGKWEWNATIVDYSAQLKAEKKKAFMAFFDRGIREIGQGRVAEAKSAFESAIDEYADDDAGERFQARAGAAAACVEYAQPFSVSYDTGELKIAVEAFKLARYFEPANAKARDGIKSYSLRLADLYVSEGMAEEYRGQPGDIKKAVTLYEEALIWNPAQNDALWLIPRAKERLADHYYRQGRNLEEGGRRDPEAAIDAYMEARTWMPEYRDTTRRIYMIKVRGEIESIGPVLPDCASEMSRLYGRIPAVSYEVDTALAQVQRIRALETRLEGFEPSIDSILSKLSALAQGTSLARQTTELAEEFLPLRQSLPGIPGTARNSEKSITPALQDSLAAIKAVTDKTKGSIEASRASLGKTSAAYGRFTDCISGLNSEKDFKEALQSLSALSRAIPAWQKALRSLNDGLDTAEMVTSDLDLRSRLVSDADSLATELESVLSDLQSTARNMESALGRTVTVDDKGKPLSFTVREILTSLPAEVKAYENQFREAAGSAVAQVSMALSVQIPDPAPFRELANERSAFSRYASLASAAAKATGDASLLVAQSEKDSGASLAALAALTSCRL